MKSLALVLAAPLALGSLIACSTDDPGSTTQDATATIVDGSPLAVGVQRFLNHPDTTLTVLDDEVPLNATAAQNLIAHRNGSDGVHGTADDDPFDGIYEVLGVSQVGPSRLQKIGAYAQSQGWVPAGDDLLGVYDDVAFTVAEAKATIDFVNGASETMLDDEIGLDSRAVESILEARPLQTVLELSQLYFVGTTALVKVRAAAAIHPEGRVGDDCTEDADCIGILRCAGIPSSPAPEIGKCADTGADIPGEGDSCGQFENCAEDLQCTGVTVYGGEGSCRPLWMAGTFYSHEALPIPDDDSDGVSSSVVVYGLATVPEDIMVTLDIDHPRPADLVVTLEGANGSEAVLWNHDQSPDYYLPALCCIDRDDFVNGVWTIHVTDTVTGEVGQLSGYRLFVTSRWD